MTKSKKIAAPAAVAPVQEEEVAVVAAPAPAEPEPAAPAAAAAPAIDAPEGGGDDQGESAAADAEEDDAAVAEEDAAAPEGQLYVLKQAPKSKGGEAPPLMVFNDLTLAKRALAALASGVATADAVSADDVIEILPELGGAHVWHYNGWAGASIEVCAFGSTEDDVDVLEVRAGAQVAWRALKHPPNFHFDVIGDEYRERVLGGADEAELAAWYEEQRAAADAADAACRAACKRMEERAEAEGFPRKAVKNISAAYSRNGGYEKGLTAAGKCFTKLSGLPVDEDAAAAADAEAAAAEEAPAAADGGDEDAAAPAPMAEDEAAAAAPAVEEEEEEAEAPPPSKKSKGGKGKKRAAAAPAEDGGKGKKRARVSAPADDDE